MTCGHLDIIQRGAAAFDRLVIAVSPASTNPEKQPLFDTAERVAMLRQVTRAFRNVEVGELSGLLVDYTLGKGANVVVKGLRAVSDFEYEFAMALMNRHLQPTVDTFYLMTAAQYSYLSSSLVKEVARLGGDLRGLVPDSVVAALENKVNSATVL